MGFLLPQSRSIRRSVAIMLCAAPLAIAACRWPLALDPKAHDQATTELRVADTAFTRSAAARVSTAEPPAPPRVDLDIVVLHVQVPQREVKTADQLWNHVREDVLDAETSLRLRKNGFRIGVGNERWWAPVRAALEAADDHRMVLSQPVRVPPGLPLALEVDDAPHDQTVFFVGFDGVLSGSTWPQSRNVLSVIYAPDPSDAARTRLYITPEVHQDREGWRLVKTESGVWQVPDQNRFAFDPAAFGISLRADEFVVIAAAENVDAPGLLGRSFLTSLGEGVRYYSYFVLKPVLAGSDKRGVASGNDGFGND